MFIVIDLIVIGIILLCTFIGYKQGLVKAAIKILSFFIAIIISLALYKPVSSIIIKNTQIDDNIKNAIVQKIIPEGMEETQEVKLSDDIVTKLVGGATSTITEIAEAFSIKIIEVTVLIILFIVIKIALKFVLLLTNIITKIPLIKQANEIRGHYIWCNKRYIDRICDINSYLFNITNDKSRHLCNY